MVVLGANAVVFGANATIDEIFSGQRLAILAMFLKLTLGLCSNNILTLTKHNLQVHKQPTPSERGCH